MQNGHSIPKIAAIIPAYNEEASIASVIDALNAMGEQAGYDLQIVVVNDASKDNTAAIAQAMDCHCLSGPYNLGIGGTVQLGIKYALKLGVDFAVQVDGDGQHPANEFPKLYEMQQETNADVVIGSRFITGEGFQSSPLRRMGIRWFMFLNHIVVGQKITDNTSGFRLLNRKAMHIVAQQYPDIYPEPEAVVLFSRSGLKIVEAPVQMLERQGGTSSISGFRSLYYMARVSLGIFIARIRSQKHINLDESSL